MRTLLSMILFFGQALLNINEAFRTSRNGISGTDVISCALLGAMPAHYLKGLR